MEELVIKAKQGDTSALEDIFIHIKNDLYKIARARFQNIEDAEDAVQETIISVIKSIHKVKNVETFKFWVIRILVNKCNTIYKKKKKYAISIEDMEDTEISQALTNNDVYENDADFYLMLKCLDYTERLIMILFYSEDYTIKEISKLLNLNENTVKTKMFRSKLKIKNNCFGGEKNGRLR